MAIKILISYQALRIKSFTHRLVFNLKAQLAIIVASSILFSLCAYIFLDFFGLKLDSIEIPAKEELRQWTLGCMVAAITLLQSPKAIWGTHSPYSSISFSKKILGKNFPSSLIVCSLILQQIALISLALFIVARCWFPFDIFQVAKITAIFIFCSIGIFEVFNIIEKSITQTIKDYLFPALTSSPNMLKQRSLTWAICHAKILSLLSHRIVANIIYIALLFSIIPLLPQFPIPLWLILYFSGLLLGIALSFFLAKDSSFLFLEHRSGIKTCTMLQSYQILGLLLGLVFILVWFLTCILSSWMNPESEILSQLGKLLLIGVTPIVIVPSVAFQIDVKQPFIQIVITALISTFLSTAIYINGYFSFLILGIILFGYQSQQDRLNLYLSR